MLQLGQMYWVPQNTNMAPTTLQNIVESVAMRDNIQMIFFVPAVGLITDESAWSAAPCTLKSEHPAMLHQSSA